jgi:PRC-barrel domain
MDVLMDRDGKVTELIVSVGGFLGLGEKDVAVPFNAVQPTSKLRRASRTMQCNDMALSLHLSILQAEATSKQFIV